MAFDFLGLNNVIILTYGEDCVITTDTGIHTIQAVFTAPYEDRLVNGVMVSNPDTVIDVKTSDIAGLSVNRRDAVTVHGANYFVMAVAPDEEGITVIKLSGTY